MEKVVISEPVRTAIGGFGGTLKDVPAVDLGVKVVNEILARTGVDPKEVDDCIMGNVLGAGLGQNPSRQVAVNSGLGTDIPGITLNRVCGSGLQSVAFAAQAIKAEDADMIVAGGIENMNLAPFYLTKARYGYRMAMPKDELIDGMVHDGLWDIFNDYHMGVTAENLAEAYNISKNAQDEFAYKSQMKTKAAMKSGKFEDEIVSVSVPQRRKDPIDFRVDEHPRPDVTQQALAGMRAVFKIGGTVTAGNASGINDGAAAVLISSESKAKEVGLKPFASLVSYAVAAVDPSIMGVGPVPAIRKALDKANLSLNDIDLFELNEAFAAQSLAVLSDLPIPESKVNVNGGAIALGHPIGASGTVILVKLLHEMRRSSAKRGLAALCIGGGMGIAMIVEKVGGTVSFPARRGPGRPAMKGKPGPKPGAKRGPGRPPMKAKPGPKPGAKRGPGRPPMKAKPGPKPGMKRGPGRPPMKAKPGPKPGMKRGPGRPPMKAKPGPKPGMKRGPGRPPMKAKPGPKPGMKRGPGRPPMKAKPGPKPGMKRGPGRPPMKAKPGPKPGMKRGPGRPPMKAKPGPKPGMKRGPGRPPMKAKPGPKPGMKRGPGRPPMKAKPEPKPGAKRGPGRPKGS